jgi:threonyl-tRNA synthetase
MSLTITIKFLYYLLIPNTMKILAIHADFIEFMAKKKAFKGAEEGVEKGHTDKIEECLVIFTAVEKRDESDLIGVLKRYLQEIKNIAKQVNAQNIVLYPYAHLSSSLSNPKIAEQLLKDAAQELSEKYQVSRAPFGWYKSFNISCKGHPLSELSREFGPEGEPQETSTQTQPKKEVDLKREYKDEPFQFNKQELTQDQKVKLTTAYLLASALKDLEPNIKIGSAGFYHDQAYIDIEGIKLQHNNIPKIQSMIKERLQTQIKEGGELNDELQQNILLDLGTNALTYQIDNITVVPLYNQPFVQPLEIKAVKILNLGSAYWKGNQNNQQLLRINLVAFDSEEKLTNYLKKQEEAQARSHLKIGKERNLFVVSDLVGAGLPLLAPNGMIIRTEIVNFLWDLHKHEGYQQVWTPHIAKDSLYKVSGHWDKFGDELLKVQGKNDQFVMKPMNCPHHMQIFDSFSLSYRDLPVRFFEPATVYRDEKSGQLLGLARVRAITQDDGHLFCRISQITEEAKSIVKIIHKFYEVMGMNKDYWVSLSVRGDDKSKYLGTDENWNIAENALEKAAQEMDLPYKRIEGEAAFYGPKLDFMFKDALGREWQLATVQCDFNLPERFDLSFMNEEGKKERPVVIHRAISGALERFMAVMIEHFAGKFPLWLSPLQVKVVTITDRNLEHAQKLISKMQKVNIRVELDNRSETMGKKIRDAQLEQVNYILTIGDKEQEKNTLAIRTRAGEQQFDVNPEQFIQKLLEEIKQKSL